MAGQLRVRLLKGWRQVNNPGPATYVRGDAKTQGPGALQFSWAQYRHGASPGLNAEGLLGICERLSSGVHGRKEVSRESGECPFGQYGTMVVKGDLPVYLQVWVLSNQRDCILITHTCKKDEPDPSEIMEAGKIALMTSYS